MMMLQEFDKESSFSLFNQELQKISWIYKQFQAIHDSIEALVVIRPQDDNEQGIRIKQKQLKEITSQLGLRKILTHEDSRKRIRKSKNLRQQRREKDLSILGDDLGQAIQDQMGTSAKRIKFHEEVKNRHKSKDKNTVLIKTQTKKKITANTFSDFKFNHSQPQNQRLRTSQISKKDYAAEKENQDHRKFKIKPLVTSIKFLNWLLQKMKILVRLRKGIFPVKKQVRVQPHCRVLDAQVSMSNQRLFKLRAGAQLRKVIAMQNRGKTDNYGMGCEAILISLGIKQSELQIIKNKIESELNNYLNQNMRQASRLNLGLRPQASPHERLAVQNLSKFIWNKYLLTFMINHFNQQQNNTIISMQRKYQNLMTYFKTRYELTNIFLGENHLKNLRDQYIKSQKAKQRRTLLNPRKSEQKLQGQKITIDQSLKNKITICQILERTHFALQKHSIEFKSLQADLSKGQVNSSTNQNKMADVIQQSIWQQFLNAEKRLRLQKGQKIESSYSDLHERWKENILNDLNIRLRRKPESQKIGQLIKSIKNIKPLRRPLDFSQVNDLFEKHYVRNYEYDIGYKQKFEAEKKEIRLQKFTPTKIQESLLSEFANEQITIDFGVHKSIEKFEKQSRKGPTTIANILQRASRVIDRVNGCLWHGVDDYL